MGEHEWREQERDEEYGKGKKSAEEKKQKRTHIRRLLRLLVLAVLDRVVQMAENHTDRVLVRHVQRQELDHVEVVDLRFEEEGHGEKGSGGNGKGRRGRVGE